MDTGLIASTTKVPVSNLSSAALAHMGDAVYEMLVRARLCTNGLLTAAKLHRRTVELVCAGAQARAGQALLSMLTEDEQAVYRRGRNTRQRHVPQASTHGEYAAATALEALFGHLYLTGQTERIEALFAVCMAQLDPQCTEK